MNDETHFLRTFWSVVTDFSLVVVQFKATTIYTAAWGPQTVK
jgi:hypothetical protein